MFCGHEYTVQNLKFAAHVEPTNQDIQDKMAWSHSQRSRNEPTVPSTIGKFKLFCMTMRNLAYIYWLVGEEKKINPFMRVTEPSVQQHAGESDPIATMGFIRQEKDNFKAK